MRSSESRKIKDTLLGGITQNPTFVLVLGMCPTLSVTTTFLNAFYLAAATAFVLICSNVIISLLRKVIPDEVRIPAYIVVIATFVTVTDRFMNNFLPKEMYETLATMITLIVVNCIILGRAEAFAGKNNVLLSFLDGLSMSAGFIVVLCIIGGLRELLTMAGLSLFSTAAGGFIVLAVLMGIFNFVYGIIKKRRKPRTLMPNAAPAGGVK